MAKGKLSLDRLEEEIQNVQYRDAAESFCRLVVEEEQAPRATDPTAIGAAAPFVQVPSHVMRQPNGEHAQRQLRPHHPRLAGRNRAHATLSQASRGAARPSRPCGTPQGLNIWDQISVSSRPLRQRGEVQPRFPGPDERSTASMGRPGRRRRSTSRNTTDRLAARWRSASTDSSWAIAEGD